MKPPSFEYVVADSVEDALRLLAEGGDDAKVIAGGQSLVPLLNFRMARPSLLVDINQVPGLANIKKTDHAMAIGALTRHAKLTTSKTISQNLPILSEAAAWIAHPQIRTRGTIGGSLAHADAAAELPVVLLALDASVTARSLQGERKIPIKELLVSHFVSSILPGELIVEVNIPLLPPGTGAAFDEFSRRHGDYAIGGAASIVTLDEHGKCSRARITVLGGGSTAIRCQEAEKVLIDSTLSSADVATAARVAVQGLDPVPTVHGSAPYRTQVIRTIVERTLAQARHRARPTKESMEY
ncbi:MULTISPECIES: 6-hydroxypseudooxynicotine dehydrogenase complex subunit alpha [unclassified Arthrobacter]|uniref:6-hydroxypseudooxynicotine dehydrogenase complex subunit alpha n=1 Tax=Micrococcaceae TaxID=1268 RepID=UPI0012F27266|nr:MULTISPECIES: 6-hydroxypseudooxynicotine dehydrogenase complex subunit alpha [unclassified Arthrobacter]BCW77961.1 carbon monoxide dehydrogenase [Arthrobacter sp. NicSoilB11]GIU57969.1 carbon monoxide dehydrogenase [Arthrobacter sp. NicSoilC12]VXB95746.1 6-hydroxypseudooxynicotine dehydrogenase complex subunit alpha [Arthrobacter sp. 8AJ]